MSLLKLDPSLKYKVKDMSLAPWGRKEIELAQNEMPVSWHCARSTATRSR